MLDPSLSLLEKFLLRRGFEVRDRFQPLLGRTFTEAEHPESGLRFVYPHPKEEVEEEDRGGELAAALTEVATGLGMTVGELERELAAALEAHPEGWECRVCGGCCRLRDAFQGTVSPEEVAAWRAAGRDDVLRLVERREKDGVTTWRAWVNPKTGAYFKRCPWLVKLPDLGEGCRGCRIHTARPLKCRAFPLFLRQAERVDCPGVTAGAEDKPGGGS